jgi:hypothetical protein
MSRINIHRGTFLEKEELVRMLSFLEDRDDISAVLSSSLTYGIVSPGAKAGTAFSISISAKGNAVDVVGGYIITSANKAFRLPDTTEFAIPEDNQFYWLKISPRERNYEDGTVQVDVSGNVSGSVSFNGVVRSQSSGVPTCIKFVKDNGFTPKNSQVYQVVDIVDDNNIILSGGQAFVKESDLKVVVLGSIPMGRRFTDEQLEGLYTFTDVEISLVEEVVTGEAPQKDNDEYYIARIKNNGGNIVWSDERSEFWSLGGGGGVPVPQGYESFQVLTETGLYENFEVIDGILQVVEQ